MHIHIYYTISLSLYIYIYAYIYICETPGESQVFQERDHFPKLAAWHTKLRSDPIFDEAVYSIIW